MLNKEIILDAAAETGIDPAFIEKDWYAVQLLKSLNEFENDRGIELVFTGGTSLSKGFGIIKRFSEDLDFILCSKSDVSRSDCRSYRNDIVDYIVSDAYFTLEPNDIKSLNGSRTFKAPIKYEMNFEQDFLRPYLQLEMTFSNHRLPLLKQDISSIISELSGHAPETQITCISPIETASDKVSALTWRVVVRDRGSDKDDPTMIRHLHDLAALKSRILEDKPSFINCVNQSLKQDQERRGGSIIAGMSIADRLEKALELLSTDKMYRDEYQQFVQSMSYADEDERISFDAALEALKEIISLITL